MPRDSILRGATSTLAAQDCRHRPVTRGLTPLHVVSHQLRHTYATSLVNAGMSLQALMALLGHRSPEMTIRYARLASPTLRDAYDQAIGKMRRLLPIAPTGPAPLPDRIGWLNSEMLKTRVAHGYCSRDLVAEACPYANICETCPATPLLPSSSPPSPTNSPTSAPSATMPTTAAGPPKQPATNASSTASKATSDDSLPTTTPLTHPRGPDNWRATRWQPPRAGHRLPAAG